MGLFFFFCVEGVGNSPGIFWKPIDLNAFQGARGTACMVECFPTLKPLFQSSAPHKLGTPVTRFKVIFGYIAKFKGNMGCETLTLFWF